MKTSRVLLVLAVALPLGAAEAQNAPAAPPPNPIATAFRNNTGRVRALLAQAFESLPDSKIRKLSSGDMNGPSSVFSELIESGSSTFSIFPEVIFMAAISKILPPSFRKEKNIVPFFEME